MSFNLRRFFQRLHRKLYRKETNYILNYLTLQVKDQEIKKAIFEHRIKQIYKIYWPLVVVTVISFIGSIFNQFVFKNGHPFLIVSAACVLFMILILTILKYIGKAELCIYLPFPFFLIAAITTSLVYTNKLPEILNGP